MKSLVPWICLIAAASQNAFADSEFNAYRLGHYNKAAEPLIAKAGKDAIADYYLGRLYLYGYGQLKNTDLAIRYFAKSAQQGYLPAVQLMAKYSLMHDKNPEEAARWFKQAATAGDVNAQLYLAAAYLYGLGVKKNLDTANHYYIDAAKNGNSLAQYALAESFLDTKHAANKKLGVIWLTKSAASGNSRALTKLGRLYIAGLVVDKDEEKGVELLNKAVAQNDTEAMVALGDLELAKGDNTKALEWYNRSVSLGDAQGYLQLAHAYLQEKSPLYAPQSGFLWTLKAAEKGSIPAKKELAELYQKGLGVSADQSMAKEWQTKAEADAKLKDKIPALDLAALWLTNGKSNRFEDTSYQMDGILSAWNNASSLRNNTYNQAPQIDFVTAQDIFKPHFELTQPNDIPINSYFDALMGKHSEFPENQWTYPLYPLSAQIESLEKVNSMVLSKFDLPAPYLEANYYGAPNDHISGDLMDIWTEGWETQANYSSVFNQMYFRAILGDAQSQFEIGQMFQYGIGIGQNDQAAIVFYQNAAEQQHLGAEYNLGILSLERAKDEKDYEAALNWLTDSAFKGNDKAQYVLARLLAQGKMGPDAKEYIKANPEQAQSMLYLSAANGYGLAQYQLADSLAKEQLTGLPLDMKEHKIALIRQLYSGAAQSGVAQALLPLAFYNAMDTKKANQQAAFSVAESEADGGDEHAALLVGMLYDRGIGTSADPAKAIYWYQRAGANPVSQFILGTYTTEGKGVALDKDKGMDLLKQSSEGHFAYADFNVSVLKQQSGQDFLPDLKKAYSLGNNQAGILLADYYLAENAQNHNPEQMNQAKDIYTGLAEKGDPNAQLKLAYMLDNGLGLSADPLAAQRWYMASAAQGNALAQYLLGQFYQVGELGGPDYTLAKQWYNKAAEKLPQAFVALGFIDETVDDNYAQALKNYEQAASQGDAFGQYNLALMYQYGKGVSVDYQKAKALYTQASDKGLDLAMNQLGGMYYYGLGQEKNDQEALSWYKKAAALGNGNALYALGLFSETGVATKIDFPDAIKYYQEASKLGNEKAMLALARMYHYGQGVEKDHKASAELYQRLADRQNAYAQYQLGTYYLEGTAGERVPDKGRKLLEQASENGSKQARQVLQRLDAQAQGKVSFIEPVQMNAVDRFIGQDAGRIYLSALNQWNRGDELKSRMMLQRLVSQYPAYVPARRAYERL